MAYDPNNPYTMNPITSGTNPNATGMNTPGQVSGQQGTPPGVATNPLVPGSQFSKDQNPYYVDPTLAGAPSGNPNAPPAGGSAFNGSTYYGKTDPASINSYVTGMLAGTGREGDAQMWANYISSKGGGPNSYWDNLITQNIGGDAPSSSGTAGGGGAYIPGQGVPGQGTIFSPQNTAGITALENQLMGIAAQDQQPVTPNDPIIQAQTNAFNSQAQQAAKNNETTAAEQGGPNANQEAINRSQSEQVGQSTGNMEATLMSNELGARRQQLQQILSQYGNTLTAEQQMQLQEELTQLGLAQGANQFQTNQNNVVNNIPPA